MKDSNSSNEPQRIVINASGQQILNPREQTLGNLCTIKRRVPRVDVRHYDPLVFVGPFGDKKKRFRVKTAAELGMALNPEGMDLSSELGKVMQLQMTIGQIEVPVSARLLYSSKDVAGFEFLDPSARSRFAIRTHFFLEFIASSLMPTLQAPSSERQSVKKLSFGNGSAYGMDIILEGDQVSSFDTELGHIGAKVRWRNNGRLQVEMSTNDEIQHDYLRNQLLGFTRNLKGLGQNIVSLLEDISCNEDIEFEYVY